MSVAAVIESSDGRLARSNSGFGAASTGALATSAAGRSGTPGSSGSDTSVVRGSAGASDASRSLSIFLRDQRSRKPSGESSGPSSARPFARRRAASERLRVGPVALSLHEHLLDMVFGDESRNRVADRCRASAPARRCCCRPRSCPRPRPDRRSRDKARRAARRRFRAAPPTRPASRDARLSR